MTSSHLLLVPWSLTVWIISWFQCCSRCFKVWFLRCIHWYFYSLKRIPSSPQRTHCIKNHIAKKRSDKRLAQLLELISMYAISHVLGHKWLVWKCKRSLVESWTPTQMNRGCDCVTWTVDLGWKQSLIPQKTKGFSFQSVLLRNFVRRSRLPEAFLRKRRSMGMLYCFSVHRDNCDLFYFERNYGMSSLNGNKHST